MFCYGKTLGAACQQTKKIIGNSCGFSLVEMMIVIVIASILAAIAFPIYSEHLAKQKRLRAELTLQRISSALEEYFVVNYTYKHFALKDYDFPNTLSNSQYRIAIHTNASHYQVTAIPYGAQAKLDAGCGSVSLTDMGVKKISGSGNIDRCWMG